MGPGPNGNKIELVGEELTWSYRATLKWGVRGGASRLNDGEIIVPVAFRKGLNFSSIHRLENTMFHDICVVRSLYMMVLLLWLRVFV